MNFILLPGNSNQSWIEDVKNILSPAFPNDAFTVQQYHHHDLGLKMIDLDHEEVILSNTATILDDVIIFAKSAGSILTIRSVANGTIHPKKCIFLGLPVLWAQKNNIPLLESLSAYNSETLFIQQTEDPFCSARELKQLLKDSGKNFQVIEIPGNDHQYDDLELIKKLVVDFVNKNETVK